MTERSVTHATFVVERSYPASPERVFAAFATSSASAARRPRRSPRRSACSTTRVTRSSTTCGPGELARGLPVPR
jgi:hypothetical protein